MIYGINLLPSPSFVGLSDWTIFHRVRKESNWPWNDRLMIAHRVAVNVNRNKPAASAEKRTHFITSPGEDCLSDSAAVAGL